MENHILRIGIVQPCPVSRSYAEFRDGGDLDHAGDLLKTFETKAAL